MKRTLSLDMRRARSLAVALGLVLAGAAGYAHHVKAPKLAVKQHPSDSTGSSTLVVTAAIAKAMARENAAPGANAPEATKTMIAWASTRGTGK